MRGRQDQQVSMLAFIDVESRIRLDHPLRAIKFVADDNSGQVTFTLDKCIRCGADALRLGSN